MKRIKLITLLTLLSIGMNLHAGCWMPESDTVKNHYQKKDGGYVRITAEGATYFLRVKGKSFWPPPSRGGMASIAATAGLGASVIAISEYLKRIFGPAGWKPVWPSRYAEHETPVIWLPVNPFLPLIKKYWPNAVNIGVSATYERDLPCYINTTDAAFERWKKNYLAKEQRKKEQEKRKQQQEAKDKLRKQQEEAVRRKQEEMLRRIHE